MPLGYSYKPSRDCYIVSGVNFTDFSLNSIPTIYNDGINGVRQVKEIADFGFYKINSIQTILIPSGIDYIGKHAFEECFSLTDIFIFNSPLEIGPSAFKFCINLTGFNFGNSLKNIGEAAFSGCGTAASNINEINFPVTMTGIGRRAFMNSSSLRKINLTTGLTNIGNQAFQNCLSLGSTTDYLTIPKNVELIESGAFGGCSSLKEVRILSRKIKEIRQNTFGGCTSLQYCIFPDSGLEVIRNGAFYSCHSLKNIYLPNTATGSKNINTNESLHFGNCFSLQYANFPTGTTHIPTDYFNSCQSLRRVDFPSDIDGIGPRAFSNCYQLGVTGVELVNYTQFGPAGGGLFTSAFTGDIKNIRLITGEGPEDLLTITGLYPKDFEIPTGLNSATNQFDSPFLNGARVGKGKLFIGRRHTNTSSLAWTSINKAREFEVDLSNPNYAHNSGFLYNKNQTTLISCPSEYSGVPIIPDHVRSIGSYSFRFCKIPTLYIGTGVGTINTYALASSDITGIFLPDNVTTLSSNIFSNCKELTNVRLSENLTAIPDYTFFGCDKLKNIYFPNKVQFLGYDCLSWTPDLESINFGTGIIVPNHTNPFNPVFGVVDGASFFSLEQSKWIGGYNTLKLPQDYKLSGINVDPLHPTLVSISGVLYHKNGTGVIIKYPPRKAYLDGYDNPNSIFSLPLNITGIYPQAFQMSSFAFKNISLHKNIQRVYGGAFPDMVNTKSLNLSNGIFDTFAFMGGGNLSAPVLVGYTPQLTGISFSSDSSNLSLADQFIGSNANSSDGLPGPHKIPLVTGLFFPSGIPLINSTISNRPFRHLINLEGIDVDPLNPFMQSQDGVVYNKNGLNVVLFPPGKTGVVKIPDNIKSIGVAFSNSKVNFIQFGTGIERLDTDAISNCNSLTGIWLGRGLSEMAVRSISQCTNLKEIFFDKNISKFNLAWQSSPTNYVLYDGGIISGCNLLETIIYPYKEYIATQRNLGFINTNCGPGGTGPLLIHQTGFLLEDRNNWNGITGRFAYCGPPWTPDGYDLTIYNVSILKITPIRLRKIIRYTPINNDEVIINHINFNYQGRPPNVPSQTNPIIDEVIPEYIGKYRVRALSGINQTTGLLSNSASPYVKTIYINTGINYIDSLYNKNIPFRVSGFNNLEAINVDPNNQICYSENGVLYNKNKNRLIAVPRKYINPSFCLEKEINSINTESFAYNQNIIKINAKGDAPEIGQNIFTGTNPNLKVYRKKNVVTGWGSTLGGIDVLYPTENIIKKDGPNNKFYIFTGNNGKLNTFYNDDC